MASNLPKLFLFALLFVALLSSPVPLNAAVMAQATTVTTNETLTLNSTTVNLCNGDTITLTGQVHIVTHTTTDSNGGSHVKTHQNFEDVSGTGTLVLTYRGVSSNNHTVNNNGSNLQQEFTSVNRVRLISQGPSDNYKLDITIHTTINANGEATSTVNNVSTTCTG